MFDSKAIESTTQSVYDNLIKSNKDDVAKGDESEPLEYTQSRPVYVGDRGMFFRYFSSVQKTCTFSRRVLHMRIIAKFFTLLMLMLQHRTFILNRSANLLHLQPPFSHSCIVTVLKVMINGDAKPLN